MKKFLVFICIMLLVPAYAGAGDLIKRLTADGVLGSNRSSVAEQEKKWAEKINHITKKDANGCTTRLGKYGQPITTCKPSVSVEQATDTAEGIAKWGAGNAATQAFDKAKDSKVLKEVVDKVGDAAKKYVGNKTKGVANEAVDYVVGQGGEKIVDITIKGANNLIKYGVSPSAGLIPLTAGDKSAEPPDKSWKERMTDFSETVARASASAACGSAALPTGKAFLAAEACDVATKAVIEGGRHVADGIIEWHFDHKVQKSLEKPNEEDNKRRMEKDPIYREMTEKESRELMDGTSTYSNGWNWKELFDSDVWKNNMGAERDLPFYGGKERSPRYREAANRQYREFMYEIEISPHEWEKILNDGLEEAVKKGYIKRSSPEYHEARELMRSWHLP